MSGLQVPGISAEQAAKLAAELKPPHFDLLKIIRPNIAALQPYRCARDDYQEGILLDANENSLGHSLPPNSSFLSSAPSSSKLTNGRPNGAAADSTPVTDALKLNRYPDPSLFGVKPRLAKMRNLPDESYVFLGVGSDEVLDLIQRVVGRPERDRIAMCPPTYGMYSVLAAVNDLGVVKIPLKVEVSKDEEAERFHLDVPKILSALEADPSIKVIFLCSPGNPTGTLLRLSDIRKVLDFPGWNGLVVVDEAYIDFGEEQLRMDGKSPEQEPVSAVSLVKEYANLIVTQTLSKAYGLAGIRLGIAFAQPPLIQIMNNTKAPYNISVPTAHLASLALSDEGLSRAATNLRQLIDNRAWLIKELLEVPAIGGIIGANDANFVMAIVLDAPKEQGGKPDGKRAATVYKIMAEEHGLVVRDRSKELGCAGCLRITVGTQEENEKCIRLLKDLLA